MSEALWQKTAIEIAAGSREKRFTCFEVMDSVVARIRAVNPQTERDRLEKMRPTLDIPDGNGGRK